MRFHIYFFQYSKYLHRLLYLQYIPRNMHTVFALLCFVVVIHWLIFPYPSGLLHWHCGNLTIAPVPAKQPWWIWINTSCEFIMNDYITTTKQSTTKPCAYFLGYTVLVKGWKVNIGADNGRCYLRIRDRQASYRHLSPRNRISIEALSMAAWRLVQSHNSVETHIIIKYFCCT